MFAQKTTQAHIYRIIEYQVGKELDYLVQTWQKHSLDKKAQHPVQLNLESVQCQGSTTTLGRLFQWLIVFVVKN